MIIDTLLKVSASQALTATALSTYVIDTVKESNFFDGKALCFVVDIEASADFTTGNETYEFDIVTGSTTTPATILSQLVVAASGLLINTKIVLPIPVGADVLRYLGVNYVLGGTTPTLTVSTYLSPLDGVDKYKSYADNSTISGH